MKYIILATNCSAENTRENYYSKLNAGISYRKRCRSIDGNTNYYVHAYAVPLFLLYFRMR